MSSFTKPLEMNTLCPGIWETTREFSFYIDEPGGEEIIIKKGYITNGASTPKVLHKWFPPNGKYAQSAVVHDWLYDRHGYNGDKIYTKKEADIFFREGMKILGVKPWKYWIMWVAVALFGGKRGDYGDKYIYVGADVVILSEENYGKKGKIVKELQNHYYRVEVEGGIIEVESRDLSPDLCAKE